MFEDSLFASTARHYPRRWTAMVAIAMQALTVGTMLVLPIIFTNALPSIRVREILPMPPVRQSVQVAAQSRGHAFSRQISREMTIHVPPIPIGSANNLNAAVMDVNAEPPNLSPAGIPGGNSEIDSLLNTGRQITPAIQGPPERRWRVSGGVEKGLLLSEVKPVYPRVALAAGIQGDVVLQAVIGKDGRIENLRAISGNSLLIQAALDAAAKWRYRPYLLNGEPVEVETQITVRFSKS